MNKGKRAPVARDFLIETAKTTHTTAVMFVANLAPKGINEAYCESFRTHSEMTANIKNDVELKKESVASTALVKDKCLECYKWGMSMKNAFKRAFKENEDKMNEFPGNFSKCKKNESLMIESMPYLFTLAEKYTGELAPKGITVAGIDAGRALLSELDRLNTDQENLKKTHESYVVDRNLAQLKLYNMINEIIMYPKNRTKK